MALTRKMLATMGIEDDKIDQIIEAHSDTVTALKDERDKYKTDALRVADLEKEISELSEDADKDGGWQKKYEDEHTAYENYKQDMAKKELNSKKSELYKQMLIDNKIDSKRINSILKVTDMDALEIGENGKFENADKINEQIKEDWSGFMMETRTEGVGADNPPNNNTDIDKESFNKMPLSKRMEYINEHPEKAKDLL